MADLITQEAILKNIKNLSFSFRGKNNVYTNQVFKHILIPMFSKSDSPFTLVYGDFNGLNKFNQKYGRDAGTLAMIDSITTIQEHLSDDAISIRIAGDEFIFIEPSSVSSDVQALLSDAENVLSRSPEKFLTMSFGIVDSSERDTIYDMYTLAENRENIAKLNSGTEEYSEEIIAKKLDIAFSKFFDNYRFSNKIELKSNHIVKLGELAIRSALDLISSEEFRTISSSKESDTQFSSLFAPEVPLFTPEHAEGLFKYISDSVSEDTILPDLAASISSTQLHRFFQQIIVNPNSNFFNNLYYKAFFESKINNTYRPATVIMLDVTGIKDCNAKKSHLETDRRLAKLSSEISRAFEDILDDDFDNDISSFNKDHNYIFNQFGGNFLVIMGNQMLSDSQAVNLFSKLNSIDISPMHLLSSYSTNRDISYSETIANLEADILSKKSRQLEGHINSLETKESFDLFISDTVDFFMKKCPTSSTIESQRAFLQQVSNSLVRCAVISNKQFELTHNKPESGNR